MRIAHPVEGKCLYCNSPISGRSDKRFCATRCARRHARGCSFLRKCRHCGNEFEVAGPSDANRQHCSKACAKNHSAKTVRTWAVEHPQEVRVYQERRVAKNPGMWREKARAERLESIRLLGGACVVCGATNPNWLHVDYIPTTRNEPFRHPRHLRWVRDNTHLLRLLCANHHYELTLTGRIEGTDITQ